MRISDWSSDVCSSDLGEHHRAGRNDGTIARNDATAAAVMVDDEVLDRCLNHREVRLLCQGRLTGCAIAAPVRLGTRSAHRRSIACIQHPALDAACDAHPTHETADRLDVTHQLPLHPTKPQVGTKET